VSSAHSAYSDDTDPDTIICAYSPSLGKSTIRQGPACQG
jgi:hypothetical protein